MKFALVFGLFATFLSSFAGAQEPYLLNPGDDVYIEVWNEPDMARAVIIMPDGYLSFPLAGQVKASGLNAQELQDSITETLKVYIADPVVTVSVTALAGNSVYVIGQVNNPGAFVMNGQMSALQALSLAGGFSAYADTKNIKIIRKSVDDTAVLRVNYSELEDGDKLETNHTLVSGDVLLVP